MKTLVATNELIRKRQTLHLATLLQPATQSISYVNNPHLDIPEDGTKAAGEKDAFNGRKRHQALRKRLGTYTSRSATKTMRKCILLIHLMAHLAFS